MTTTYLTVNQDGQQKQGRPRKASDDNSGIFSALNSDTENDDMYVRGDLASAISQADFNKLDSTGKFNFLNFNFISSDC